VDGVLAVMFHALLLPLKGSTTVGTITTITGSSSSISSISSSAFILYSHPTAAV